MIVIRKNHKSIHFIDLYAHVFFAVNGEAEHVDFIESSVTEEEEEEIRMDPPTPPLTAPPLVPVIHCLISNIVRSCCCSKTYVVCNTKQVIDCVIDFQDQQENSSLPQTQDSTVCRYAFKTCCQRYPFHGTAHFLA